MQGKAAGEAIAELLNRLEVEGFSFNPTDGVIYMFAKGSDRRLRTLGRITEGSTTEATGWRFVTREEYSGA